MLIWINCNLSCFVLSKINLTVWKLSLNMLNFDCIRRTFENRSVSQTVAALVIWVREEYLKFSLWVIRSVDRYRRNIDKVEIKTETCHVTDRPGFWTRFEIEGVLAHLKNSFELESQTQHTYFWNTAILNCIISAKCTSSFKGEGNLVRA